MRVKDENTKEVEVTIIGTVEEFKFLRDIVRMNVTIPDALKNVPKEKVCKALDDLRVIMDKALGGQIL